MKSNLLIILGVACLITSTRADVWTEVGNKCFACLSPNAEKPGQPIGYCTMAYNCQYNTFLNCDEWVRITSPQGCILSSVVKESPACDDITNLSLNETPHISTIKLGVNEYCEITVTGEWAKLKISYPGEGTIGAVYHPEMDQDYRTIQPSGTELDAKEFWTDKIKVVLVNYHTSESAIFAVEASDPSVSDPTSKCDGGSDGDWTGRDGKCFSCLNPHDTNPTKDPVYWCKDTETCEYSSTTCSGATRLSLPTSCIQHASKTEDPACAAINSLLLTPTPQTRTVTILPDSFCYITLTGVATTLRVSYSGSGSTGAVYYPSSSWDASTFQASDTRLSAVTLGETTELKVALVNYDPSASVTFIVHAADNNALEWTGSNDKCFSCLNPHDINPTNDPVYYCLETGACEHDPCMLCAPTTRIANPFSCIQEAEKTEDPACEAVSNLILTETPQSATVTLPADSFCHITLTGATTTLKVTYSGSGSSGAVYYPTNAWGASTLQASETLLDAAALGETSELKVALVNYNPSVAVTFTVEAADTSAPDSNN